MKKSALSRAVLLYVCCSLLVFAGFSGWFGTDRAYANDAISRLVLSTNVITLSVDDSQSITATAIYESGSTEDVTILTDWSSGDTSIATVYNGTIMAKSEGTTVITATYKAKTVVVNVTINKKVRSLTKSKSTVAMRIDGHEQINLTATYTDNSTENVNTLAEWSIDNDAVASISNGLVTGLTSGQATITAKYGTKSVAILVNVDVARRLDVDQTSLELRTGGTQQLKLMATFDDGSVVDVADKAVWSTDHDNVADAIKGLVTAYGSGEAILTAQYGTKVTSILVTVEMAKRLDVNKSDLVMKVDQSEQLTLKATFADGSVEDVTKLATWTAENENILSVATGKITTYHVGQTTVTAAYGSKTVSISVNAGVPKQLEASSSSLTMHKGDVSPITITATYIDGKKETLTDMVTWTSDNEDIAFAQEGNIYVLASGQANLTAEYGGKKVVVQVSVDTTRSLNVSVRTLSMKTDETKKVTATVTYTDGTTKDVTQDAVWTTDSAEVVSVDHGSLTALKSGQASITATYGNQTSVTTVQVDNVKKLTLSETALFLHNQASKQLVLTAYYDDGTSKEVTSKATWTSDKEEIAYIIDGTVYASAAGQATLTASYSGKTSFTTVDVDIARKLAFDKTSLSLRSGDTGALTLTATYADGKTEDVTSKAEWKSGNEDIFYAGKGSIQAYHAGEAVLTAKYGEKTATITIQVDAAKTLTANQDKWLLQLGDTSQITLTATYTNDEKEDVTSQAEWIVKNPQIATVKNGQITALTRGATTVTAKFGVNTVDITISVGEITRLALSEKKVALSDGGSKQVSLTVYFKDGTTKVVTDDADWTSSSSGIARVSQGLIEADDSGKATITAVYGDQTATVAVEVNVAQSLTANKRSIILKQGDSFQVQLTMTNSGGKTEDVTEKADWAITSTKIGDISSSGLVTTYERGKTTVTAKYGGKTLSIPLEVDAAQKLVLSKKSLQLKTSQSEALSVTAYFTDGSSRDVSKEAEWTTTKASVADVDNGTVSALNSGKATVKAQFGGKSISLTVEVDKLKYLKANTTRVDLTAGKTSQLTLTATYADGTEGSVSSAAIWTSSNEKAVDVKDGKLTAVYKGTSRITGKFAGKSVTVVVTVK